MVFAFVIAASTQVIPLQGVDDLSQGSFMGTALTRQGELVPAASYTQQGTLPGPVVKVLKNGQILIGSPLRLVSEKGDVLFKDEERHVGNACFGRSGTYLSGMPGGLLRFQARSSKTWQVVALPSSHRSLWGIACTAKGAVIAAGEPAALYRVEGMKVTDSIKVPGDALRSVLVMGESVYAGGLNDGRIWRWYQDTLDVLHVAAKPEVRKLIALSGQRLAVLSIASDSDDSGDLPEPTPASRGSGAVEGVHTRSTIAQTFWMSSGATPMDMVSRQDQLWVATDAGRLHQIDTSPQLGDARRSHRRSAVGDGRPIEALAFGTKGLLVFGGGIMRRATEGKHLYRSPVLDAGGQIAHWGNLRVDSQSVASVRWRFGQSAALRGWSEWTKRPGSLARYAQFELELKKVASVRYIQQFVRAINRAPAMINVLALAARTRLEAKPQDLNFDKGVSLPDDELEDYQMGHMPKSASERARMTRQPGYRAITWKASDPDDDALVFRIQLLRLDQNRVQTLKTWQQTQHYTTITTSVLPHGTYRLDVAVRDGQSSWSAPRSSRPFLNDHRPPRMSLVDFNLSRRVLRLKVEDDDHTVAVVCGNQENRVELIPSDGVADGSVEQFTLPQRDWVESLIIRRCEAIDASGNRAGIDLSRAGQR